MGRIFIELGYSFYFFSKDVLIYFGILLKLGIFPFIWWLPRFLKNKNWSNFFFFNILNKIPLLYLFRKKRSYFTNIWFIIILIFGVFGLLFSSIKISGIKKIKNFLGWASIIDTVFFCWLSIFDKKSFFLCYLIYRIIYLIISIRFYFCLNSFNLKLQSNFNNNLFVFSSVLILIKIGFPPFLPFLNKYILILKVSRIFKLNFIYFFFFISLIQRLLYLYLFFKINNNFLFYFKKNIFSINLILIIIYLFFLFLFFW
jgi:NADH:ubiquinone oxidoreductase subunit 2 (subunit N)